MEPASGRASHGFDLSFSTTFTGGDCPTIDHYVATLKEGTVAPSGPTDGRSFGMSGGAGQALPHRAERTYAARIFACKNAACTSWYGGGSESIATGAANDGVETDETDPELWVIVDTTHDENGLSADALDDEAGAPSVFIYPSGHMNAGKLVIYDFDDDARHVSRSVTTGAGWQNYNAAAFTAHAEAAGDHASDVNYDAVSHPYVLPVEVEDALVIRLLAQNQGTTGYRQVVWADSESSDGDSFGMDCASCCADTTDSSACDWPAAATAGTAGVAVCADGSSSCGYLESALHGRWMWDYVAHPWPDLGTDGDEPSILFTGEPNGSDCPDVGTSPHEALPDIYQATWDGDAWQLLDADADGCPDAVIEDAHDPAIIPLPNGAFKVYVFDAAHDLVIHYFDGTSWEEDTSEPLIIWDESPIRAVDPSCIANPEAIVHVESGVPHEGLFLNISNSDSFWQGGYCDPGDGTEWTSTPGDPGPHIWFAELEN